ncbi:MAG: hypothetical protein NTZ60_05495 [Campylobacterales bacterium]|nr:hypothetical protein [Campylobacterales bacterium]
MLDEIIIKLRNSYTDEDYLSVIENLYEDIYDEVTEDNMYAIIFEEECSFEVKELITQYLNHDNFREIEKDTKGKINKKITDALELLQKYKTPEYQCLVDNGFCNPLSERPSYEGYINEHWHIEYKQQFVDKAQKLGIEEQVVYKMILGLENII